MNKVQDAGIELSLTESSIAFIQYIDQLGRYRYLEKSNYALGDELVKLDGTVWKLRRFCTLDLTLREVKLRQGVPAAKVRIEGGVLEKIIHEHESPAREPLLWQNAFFGRRVRRRVRSFTGLSFKNSPLFLHPPFIDEVKKYVFLPSEI